jgi:hypothetical protein
MNMFGVPKFTVNKGLGGAFLALLCNPRSPTVGVSYIVTKLATTLESLWVYYTITK